MTGKKQAAAAYLNGSNEPPERLAAFGDSPGYDDYTADEDWPADAATGLVSLAFLKAVIRRSARFCCIMAVIGFIIGCGIYVMSPAPYKATTSLLLTYSPYESGQTAPADNQAMVQTRTVASLAMKKLGLNQDVGSFLSAYTTTAVSNRIFLITFNAPSADVALRGASAVAAEFLQFRASQLERQQEQVLASLRDQLSQAKQELSSIKAQVSQVSAQPASPAQQSQLTGLEAKLTQETSTQATLQQAVSNNEADTQPTNTTAVQDSKVLDAAALLPRSHLRHLLLYPAAGIIGGLIVGIAIVLVGALVSDRLRRRDDVADALGAPVKLSTGPLWRTRWLLGRRKQAATREASIQRIATHLSRAVQEDGRGTAALAVVAADNAEATALPLVRLATSCAEQGQRVVLADLADGAPAAKLLGRSDPGVGVAHAQHTRLVVAVPERTDVAPIGPFGRRALAPDQGSGFTGAVASACAEADLLVAMVTLDPSLGGDHLPTWAADVVVVVTAGRSSWTKINAVGEMIRLSGAHLVSGVLIGADRDDESLGVVYAQEADGGPR